MKTPIDGIRKAAVFVATLERTAADLVLEQMDAQQARQVRDAMIELGEIDPDERRRVIEEFCRIGPSEPPKEPEGVELDDRLARKLSDGAAQLSVEGTPSPAPGASPFCFLHNAEADKLARVLTSERPQTIALVLSHLPAEQAGSVLVRFPAPLQVEVVRRLVDLEETDPEILREVERALQSRVSEQILKHRPPAAGLSAVTGILEASNSQVGMRILENVASHDQKLAEKLCPQRLEFDDLASLDDQTLATILEAAEPQVAVLALVGAPPAMIQRVTSRLPAAEAEAVRRQLDHIGPVRLSDVEEARGRIVELARRLIVQRQIRPPQLGPKPPAEPADEYVRAA